MSKDRRTIRILANFLAISSLYWLCACTNNYSGKATPKIVNGSLDLSSWDFVKDGPVKLEGDWLFFWNQFLTPNETTAANWSLLSQEAERIKVPGFFIDRRGSDGGPIQSPTSGFGSYLLRIKGAANATRLSLSRARIHSSSRIFTFNSEDRQKSLDDFLMGQAGSDAQSSVPHIMTLTTKILQLNPNKDFYILIHISNFHFSKGGISPAPILDEAHNAIAESLEARTLTGAAAGIALALAFYNLTLFMRNRRDRASLYLSLFCSIIVWRIIASLFFSSPGQFNLEVQYKTIYATMLIEMPFLGLFLRDNFPKQMPRKILFGYSVLCFGYSTFVLLTPTIIFSKTVALGQISLAMGCLFMFLVILRACFARELGSIFSLIGTAFLITTTVCDILYAIGYKTGDGMSVQYGLVFFLFMQSQIVGIRFAAAFHSAEHLSLQLQDEVDRQTRDTKSILKSIRQGIFSIRASNQKTDDQNSAFLGEILNGAELQNQSIQELLLSKTNLSADIQNQVEAAVNACLGEDSLAFDLNEGNLVREILLPGIKGGKERILEVDWAPILDKDQTIEKLLVCLRDVTDLREIQHQADLKDQDLRMLIEVLNLPEDRFQRFIKNTQQFLGENHQLISSLGENSYPKPDLMKRLFVNMHTIKGGARSYLLKTLSDQSHIVEQNYVNILQGSVAWNKPLLLDELDGLSSIINLYLRIAREKLGWNTEQREIRMAKDTMESTITQLNEIQRQHLDSSEVLALNAAHFTLVEHCHIRISSLIEEVKPGLQSMARDLGKEMPELKIYEGEIWLSEKAGNILHSCFVHLFRNAIDHGLEKADERLRKGKPAKGVISIKAECKDNDLSIIFSDDGRGLNLEKIRLLGIQRQLIPSAEDSPQVAADLILQSGFSTKDEVSEISGRGVGMDAIRTFLQDHEGFIFIELGDTSRLKHVPFEIKILLPRILCSEAAGKEKAV